MKISSSRVAFYDYAYIYIVFYKIKACFNKTPINFPGDIK